MFRRRRTVAVKEQAAAASELAARLANDKKFRKQLDRRHEARLAREAARGQQIGLLSLPPPRDDDAELRAECSR